MMKNKKTTRLLIFLFLLAFIISCENENLQQSIEENESLTISEDFKSEYNVERVSFDNIELLNQNVSSILSKQRLSQSRHSINGIEFEVLENQGVKISKGDYDSYTFPIILNGQTNDNNVYS